MKIACIIPAYNFVEGVKRISNWIAHEYHFLASEYRVALVDDHSDPYQSEEMKKIGRLDNFTVLTSKGERSLRKAILTGYDCITEDWVPDVVNIIETDALPETATLQAMLRVYREARGRVGSVSPIYTWGGNNCYPTNKHWFSDAPAKEMFSSGTVREPGECGVPFLFSIWNPDTFELMRDDSLPDLARLDSEFGKKVHRAGFRHLRVTNYTIEHWKGGRQSDAIKLSK